jgi:hypothetical protein
MPVVTIIDTIGQAWSSLLEVLSKLIIPDWAGLILLLPVFVLILMIGPLITLAVLAWLGYGITKPRTKVTYEGDVRRIAPRDDQGLIVAPLGEPYCPLDGTIYPSNQQRCDIDKAVLLLRCPKCDVIREAGIATCGNCGLSLALESRVMVVATDGPPPGGAAVA